MILIKKKLKIKLEINLMIINWMNRVIKSGCQKMEMFKKMILKMKEMMIKKEKTITNEDD